MSISNRWVSQPILLMILGECLQRQQPHPEGRVSVKGQRMSPPSLLDRSPPLNCDISSGQEKYITTT